MGVNPLSPDMEAIHTSKFYSDILRRIGSVRKNENRLSIVYGILAASMLVTLFLLAAVVLEELLAFGIVGRTILFVSAAFGILGSIAWFVGRPLLRAAGILKSADNASLALTVGKYFPEIHDRLLDAIQIYEQREALKSNYSVDLIDASFSDLYRQIEPLRFTDAVHDFAVWKMGKVAVFAFGVFLLTVVVSPSGFLGSLYRVGDYDVSFASPLRVRFMVKPGNNVTLR